MITFPDNGRKPRMDRRTDAQVDGRTLTVPMSSPDFISRDNRYVSNSAVMVELVIYPLIYNIWITVIKQWVKQSNGTAISLLDAAYEMVAVVVVLGGVTDWKPNGSLQYDGC